MNRLFVLAAMGAIAACSKTTVTTTDAAGASSAAASAAPSPSPAPPPSSPAAPSASASAAVNKCEVEIRGRVKFPTKPASTTTNVIVAIGDCLDPAAPVAGFGGSTPAKDGAFSSFFVEVFVPWGSDLTICAADMPKEGAPSTLYGKSKLKMHAEAHGEVEFKDVVIEMVQSAPKTFKLHPN